MQSSNPYLKHQIEAIVSILEEMTSTISQETHHNYYTPKIVQAYARSVALMSYINNDKMRYQDLPETIQLNVVTSNIALTLASHIIAQIDARKPTPEKVYEFLCSCAYTDVSEFSKEQIQDLMIKLDNDVDVVMEEIKNTTSGTIKIATPQDIIGLVNGAINSIDNKHNNNNN